MVSKAAPQLMELVHHTLKVGILKEDSQGFMPFAAHFLLWFCVTIKPLPMCFNANLSWSEVGRRYSLP